MDIFSAILAFVLSGEPADLGPKDAYVIEDGRVVDVDCNDMSKYFDEATALACGRHAPSGSPSTSNE
jgi:hypothetical protein